MTVWAAARVDDPMTHTFAAAGSSIGLVLGIAGGIVVGIKLAPLGPIAINAGLNAAMAGAYVGEVLGSKLKQTTGKIKTGAVTVLVGPERHQHARIEDPIECADPAGQMGEQLVWMLVCPLAGAVVAGMNAMKDFGAGAAGAHVGKVIRTGSTCVAVENRLAARVEDKSDCEAKIEKGCETVLEGGDPVALAGTEFGSEVPAVVGWTVYAMDWADAIVSLVSARQSLKKALGDGTAGWALRMKKVGVVTAWTGLGLKGTRDLLNAAKMKDEAFYPDGTDKVIKTTELVVNFVVTPGDTKLLVKAPIQANKDITAAHKVGRKYGKRPLPTVERTR